MLKHSVTDIEMDIAGSEVSIEGHVHLSSATSKRERPRNRTEIKFVRTRLPISYRGQYFQQLKFNRDFISSSVIGYE